MWTLTRSESEEPGGADLSWLDGPRGIEKFPVATGETPGIGATAEEWVGKAVLEKACVTLVLIIQDFSLYCRKRITHQLAVLLGLRLLQEQRLLGVQLFFQVSCYLHIHEQSLLGVELHLSDFKTYLVPGLLAGPLLVRHL